MLFYLISQESIPLHVTKFIHKRILSWDFIQRTKFIKDEELAVMRNLDCYVKENGFWFVEFADRYLFVYCQCVKVRERERERKRERERERERESDSTSHECGRLTKKIVNRDTFSLFLQLMLYFDDRSNALSNDFLHHLHSVPSRISDKNWQFVFWSSSFSCLDSVEITALAIMFWRENKC
jgi:hypothetical protein